MGRAGKSPAQSPPELLSQHRRRAEVRQVALNGEHVYGVPAAEVVLEVRGDRSGHGHVLGRLDDVARHLHEPQYAPQVAVEHRPGHEQRYVRPHVEQRPAELPHRRRHVRPHRQRREPPHPRLVVRLHRREHFLDLPLLESPMVLLIIQKPKILGQKMICIR